MAADPRSPRWAPAPAVAWETVPDGGAVVMALTTGVPLLLSPSGGLIWDVLLGHRTPAEDLGAHPPAPLTAEEVAAGVAELVGLEAQDLAGDVRAFLQMLAGHGVVVTLPGG